MKIKYSLLFFFVPILLLSLKCRKDEVLPQLPAETQTGANTFGCKINDEIYTPRGTGSCYNYLVQYYKSDSTLLIKTNSTCANGLNIYLYKVSHIGDYLIFNPITNAFLYANSNSTCSWFDRNNSLQTGIVTITKLDLTSKIISGRFNGTLKISGCSDINITEGRFDFKMDVYN